jgi:siroheme synthase (precorrin-2 oxidase/ferrochelatase)
LRKLVNQSNKPAFVLPAFVYEAGVVASVHSGMRFARNGKRQIVRQTKTVMTAVAKGDLALKRT